MQAGTRLELHIGLLRLLLSCVEDANDDGEPPWENHKG